MTEKQVRDRRLCVTEEEKQELRKIAEEVGLGELPDAAFIIRAARTYKRVVEEESAHRYP